MVVSVLLVNGHAGPVADGWFLAAPVGLSFDDQFVGGGDEAVDGGLGEQRVGHHREPFFGGAVGGHDGGGALVAFDAELVEVGGLGGVEWLEREVVQDEELDSGEAAHLVVEGVVEPGGFEPFEQLAGAGHVHGASAADGDVPQRGGHVGLPDADRAEDEGAVRAVEEPQAGQFVPQVLVVADGGGLVPGVEPHAGVEPGGAGAQGGGLGFAAGDFVGQDQFEEVSVGHLLLAGEGEPVREGGQHLAELERPQGRAQVGADRIAHGGGHRVPSFPRGTRVSWVARYSAGSRANRAVAATGGRGGGGVFSVARSSIEAILVTLTTSSSSARWQAVSTGPGPYRRTRPSSR